jgi:hypothetical protein
VFFGGERSSWNERKRDLLTGVKTREDTLGREFTGNGSILTVSL